MFSFSLPPFPDTHPLSLRLLADILFSVSFFSIYSILSTIRRKAAYEKRKKEEEEAKVKKASLMDKFGGKASSVGPVGPRKTVAGGSTRMMAQNPATIKAKLLEWSQRCSKGYPVSKLLSMSLHQFPPMVQNLYLVTCSPSV